MLLEKCNLAPDARNNPHGKTLAEIFEAVLGWIQRADLLVREKGFSRFATETQALFKVVGVTDLAAWQSYERRFEEIAPASVKKLITGRGDASKEAVAAALEPFVGKQDYQCQDESDAVAVAIAWLLQNDYIRRKGT